MTPLSDAFAIALCAGISGAGSLVGERATRGVQPGFDAPPAGRAPTGTLMLGAAALGAVLAWHGAPFTEFGLVALLVFPLSASWTTDVTRGIVFDAFTLGPLGAILAVGVIRGEWSVPIAAGVLALPFMVMALLSRGTGMGWGDVELAALGGAVMGLQMAPLLFAIVSLVAFAVAMLRKTRGPIAFAPYLIAAIVAGLALGGPFI